MSDIVAVLEKFLLRNNETLCVGMANGCTLHHVFRIKGAQLERA